MSDEESLAEIAYKASGATTAKFEELSDAEQERWARIALRVSRAYEERRAAAEKPSALEELITLPREALAVLQRIANSIDNMAVAIDHAVEQAHHTN